MDKQAVLQAVLVTLEEELRRQLAAQQTAADGATHAEARAETKWDTCGLEQSYLARGHAKQFESLVQQVEVLRNFDPPCFSGRSVAAGALIEVEIEGERLLFFLLDGGGGTEVEVGGRDVTVITSESPVGAVLLGKKQGDTYSFRAGTVGRIRLVE